MRSKIAQKMEISSQVKQEVGFSSTLHQALKILSMSIEELDSFLDGLILETPSLGWREAKSFSSYEAFSKEKSLYEHLIEQAKHVCKGSLYKVIESLIGNIDEKGFLPFSIEEMSKQFNENENIIIEALGVIQSFDPIGVGTNGPKEALLKQLFYFGKKRGFKIIEGCYDDFIHMRWEKIANKEGVSYRELMEIIDQEIRILTPFPGMHFSTEKPEIMKAEVSICHSRAKWSIMFIRDLTQEIIIVPNKPYSYEGRCALKFLYKRKEILLLLLQKVIETQEEYILGESKYLKPLSIQDVATELSLNPSTISRAIRGKLVETPLGVLHLSHFFTTKSFETEDGTTSQQKALLILQELITSETRKKLSDQALAEKMKEQGIPISRRTVAKYRKLLNIPRATIRKRLSYASSL